jgi:predicted O-linked N-acetylglucosamine transferase (SPINDLY family)
VTELQALFDEASSCFEAEELTRAEQLLDQLIGRQPCYAAAWHLRGMVAHQRCHNAKAVDYFKHAEDLEPSNPTYISCLGAAYHALGQHAQAVDCQRRALALRPNDAQALNNLGVALIAQGKTADSLTAFRQALAIVPDDPGALCNLAAALASQKQYVDAVPLYRRVLELCPGLAQAHNNLGNALAATGHQDEAESAYIQALKYAPRFALAQANLGRLLHGRGRLRAAIAAYRQALLLQPRDADLTKQLARALLENNRMTEALATCQDALRLHPHDPEIWNDLGNVCYARGDLDDAQLHYEQASALQPGWSMPVYNRGLALQSQGRLTEARRFFLDALEEDPDDAVAHSTYVGSLHYDPFVHDDALFAAHRDWADRHVQPQSSPVSYASDADPNRPLRVGYVSPDFRSHAVAYFVEPILAHHDPACVESFAYAEVRAPDDVTKRLQGLVRHWRDTAGWPDEELADCIRRDNIDILVDLAGHTAQNRLLLFARRPAPIQVSYLGYPGTTGLPTIDYRITDAIADPLGGTHRASETLVRLPHVFCCYQPPTTAPVVRIDVPSQQTGFITFGALHKLEKYNAAVIDLWCALLRDLPTSRLLLGRNTLHGVTARYWIEQFARRGIDPARLILRRLDVFGLAHLRAYHEIDIALDAFPWNGHTTACEALWMGVPVLTLSGNRHASRMTASVLHALDLQDFVACTPDAYRQLAVTLASDESRRMDMRTSLRDRMLQSVLCNGAAFTSGLEEAYRDLWRRWCKQNSL